MENWTKPWVIPNGTRTETYSPGCFVTCRQEPTILRCRGTAPDAGSDIESLSTGFKCGHRSKSVYQTGIIFLIAKLTFFRTDFLRGYGSITHNPKVGVFVEISRNTGLGGALKAPKLSEKNRTKRQPKTTIKNRDPTASRPYARGGI